jgi:hypothetical protein
VGHSQTLRISLLYFCPVGSLAAYHDIDSLLSLGGAKSQYEAAAAGEGREEKRKKAKRLLLPLSSFYSTNYSQICGFSTQIRN